MSYQRLKHPKAKGYEILYLVCKRRNPIQPLYKLFGKFLIFGLKICNSIECMYKMCNFLFSGMTVTSGRFLLND